MRLSMLCVVLLLSVMGWGQVQPATNAYATLAANMPRATVTTPDQNRSVVPEGTQVLLSLKQAISTRDARAGDRVYAETAFPVVLNGEMLIPGGTYVQGVIDRVQRAGHFAGKAEVQMHFNTLIFPNGYVVGMPAALESVSGAHREKVIQGAEGTIVHTGHEKTTATASSAATGALAGGLSNGAKGALIGGGIGGAAGFAIASLLRENREVMLPPGATIEMIIKRPLALDNTRIYSCTR